jgi:phosphatidylglycerophosphatase A
VSTARSKTAWVIATWFGCGRSPVAPGTVGSLGAIPLYLAVVRAGPAAVAAVALAVVGVGIWAASTVAREAEIKDPGFVVIDEVAGMLLTLVPLRTTSLQGIAVGFAVFRVLDIAKPWPIRSLEKWPGGWGIMADDVAAGLVGACIVALLQTSALL